MFSMLHPDSVTRFALPILTAHNVAYDISLPQQNNKNLAAPGDQAIIQSVFAAALLQRYGTPAWNANARDVLFAYQIPSSPDIITNAGGEISYLLNPQFLQQKKIQSVGYAFAKAQDPIVRGLEPPVENGLEQIGSNSLDLCFEMQNEWPFEQRAAWARAVDPLLKPGSVVLLAATHTAETDGLAVQTIRALYQDLGYEVASLRALNQPDMRYMAAHKQSPSVITKPSKINLLAHSPQ